MPWQKTARLTQLSEEIEANTAFPVDKTVSVRTYAAHGQARHKTFCAVVEVPSNDPWRDLICVSLPVLQEPEVYSQSTIIISLLKYFTWFLRHKELITKTPLRDTVAAIFVKLMVLAMFVAKTLQPYAFDSINLLNRITPSLPLESSNWLHPKH